MNPFTKRLCITGSALGVELVVTVTFRISAAQAGTAHLHAHLDVVDPDGWQDQGVTPPALDSAMDFVVDAADSATLIRGFIADTEQKVQEELDRLETLVAVGRGFQIRVQEYFSERGFEHYLCQPAEIPNGETLKTWSPANGAPGLQAAWGSRGPEVNCRGCPPKPRRRRRPARRAGSPGAPRSSRSRRSGGPCRSPWRRPSPTGRPG